MFYPGEHAAIVEVELWDRINAELRAARRGENPIKRQPQKASLQDVLFCATCKQPMRPTYTAKGNRRFRYYICYQARSEEDVYCKAPFPPEPSRPMSSHMFARRLERMRTNRKPFC